MNARDAAIHECIDAIMGTDMAGGEVSGQLESVEVLRALLARDSGAPKSGPDAMLDQTDADNYHLATENRRLRETLRQLRREYGALGSVRGETLVEADRLLSYDDTPVCQSRSRERYICELIDGHAGPHRAFTDCGQQEIQWPSEGRSRPASGAADAGKLAPESTGTLDAALLRPHATGVPTTGETPR